MRWSIGLWGLLPCLVAPVVARAAEAQPQSLAGKSVVVDSSGKLLSWMQPQETAYSRTALTAWEFLNTQIPTEANGLKTYFTYPGFSPVSQVAFEWLHHPAGLNAMLLETSLAIHAYSGDASALELPRSLMDYQLAHGMTPSEWVWGNVPFSSSMPGATTYAGGDDLWACGGEPCGRGDGLGVVEPDKVGESGLAYLRLFQVTGEGRYRDVAIACANALAANVREGDEWKSPWPMRVRAETGEAREEYGAHVIAPIRLFDELRRLRLGDGQAYLRARQMAWDWMMRVPMSNNHWSGYFEDIPIMSSPDHNPNQYIPLETARYLLQRPEFDPQWKAHARQLLDYTERVFAADTETEKGLQWGAHVITEQLYFPFKMGSHTARYASVQALWFDRTGEAPAKEKAFRSFNWSTYMNNGSGLVSTWVGEGDTWFTDGYGDYIRHYMSGMAAVPEWAPPGENHLLGTSSVVKNISYGAEEISYSTFEANATEVLRLDSRPGRVLAGGRELRQVRDLKEEGYTLRALGADDFELRVHHVDSGNVTIDLRPGPEGCGCGAGGGQGAGALALALLALWRRRSRG
jgi:MYXO-CTERM domain-containing protein